MIETIRNAEYQWFLLLNGLHSPFFDEIMYWVSYRFTWLPLYAFLIYYLYKKTHTFFWQNLIFVAISAGFSDRFTTGFMKPYFQRLRPCHDPMIQKFVHLVGNCGGEYGFASSHAANCFALFMSFYLLYGNAKLTFFLLFWAIIVSYSRIYVGVHFPSDIIVGALVGIFISILLFSLKTKILHQHFSNLKP